MNNRRRFAGRSLQKSRATLRRGFGPGSRRPDAAVFPVIRASPANEEPGPKPQAAAARLSQRPANGAATKPIVLGVLVIAAVAAFWLAGRPDRPNEANRVFGPGGVSIVQPRGWSIRSINSNGDDHFANIMTLQPKEWIGITPTIVVQTFRSPPTPDQFPGWGQIMFEGQPALSMMYEHPKFRNRVVVMQREQKWFQVSLTTPDPAADPMDLGLWKFLETFRYDGAAGGSSAATQPALPGFMQPASQGG